MKGPLLIAVVLIFNQSALAQDDCACCTISHKQFDFWIGEWEVYDTLGNTIGTNSIDKLVSNCALSEHWQGTSGVEGRSYSYYNTSDSTWNQLWIDSSGSNLVLKGKLIGKSMVLESTFVQARNVGWYKNRVTWTPSNDGSLTQIWDIVSKNEETLRQIFKGVYIKATQ